MQSEELLKALSSGKHKPVYLFLGDSPFLMEEAWKALLSKSPAGAGKGGGGERVRAAEISAGQVIERLATLSMFGARRLMVEGIDSWTKGDLTALGSFLPRIPATACLVLTSKGKKGIEGLTKSVESVGEVVQFRAPSGKEAPRWLMERARERGKILAHRAAFLLVEMAGDDFHTLLSELEKICTFVGERETIEAEDVQESACSQRNFSMFDLLDQIKARQAGKAVRSLRGLIISGESPLKVLASLAWQIRIIWQIKEGMRQGLTEAQITQKLKLHPYVVKKAREQAARYAQEDLHEILDAMRQADVSMKSTGTSPEMILEELLLDLCLPKKKPSGAIREL
jgi:DNA polymerase-3 subunit delta